jgi:hypothetical protein
MSARAPVVPYEAQPDRAQRRDCGAACLRMVYASLGKDIPQAEIWPAIAKENRFGAVSSTTYLMAKDALSRGLAAIAFQARHPLQALRLCLDSGTRAILNHRPGRESLGGHYSVLVDMNDREIVLHDPFFGPSRCVPQAEFLELWKPALHNSEISGYMLIAIADESAAASACWLCRSPMPLAAVCPGCKQQVVLRPGGPLGCVDTACVARMWNYICCPFCDCGFTVGGQTVAGGQTAPPDPLPGPSAAALAAAPLDFAPVFAAINKFCNQVLTIPGAADHPLIKQRLDAIAAGKEGLKQAATEAALHRKAHQENMAKLEQAVRQNEAYQKELAERNAPSAPLDGDALGRALMKNLGFVR